MTDLTNAHARCCRRCPGHVAFGYYAKVDFSVSSRCIPRRRGSLPWWDTESLAGKLRIKGFSTAWSTLEVQSNVPGPVLNCIRLAFVGKAGMVKYTFHIIILGGEGKRLGSVVPFDITDKFYLFYSPQAQLVVCIPETGFQCLNIAIIEKLLFICISYSTWFISALAIHIHCYIRLYFAW